MPPASCAWLRPCAPRGDGRTWSGGGARRAPRLPIKDYDIEVFDLPPERLEPVLAGRGRVDAVGQAFRVYKLSGVEGAPGAVDVALPRRDSKIGPATAHRGLWRSRPRGRGGRAEARLHDERDAPRSRHRGSPRPLGGRRDLEARLLRAVDARTFGEDPLRALRAVQFAARYELSVEPATAALCASMPLAELPADRSSGRSRSCCSRPAARRSASPS